MSDDAIEQKTIDLKDLYKLSDEDLKAHLTFSGKYYVDKTYILDELDRRENGRLQKELYEMTKQNIIIAQNALKVSKRALYFSIVIGLASILQFIPQVPAIWRFLFG